jgi:hypothetical protein
MLVPLTTFLLVAVAEAMTPCERRRKALLEAEQRGENVRGELNKPCPLGAPKPKKPQVPPPVPVQPVIVKNDDNEQIPRLPPWFNPVNIPGKLPLYPFLYPPFPFLPGLQPPLPFPNIHLLQQIYQQNTEDDRAFVGEDGGEEFEEELGLLDLDDYTCHPVLLTDGNTIKLPRTRAGTQRSIVNAVRVNLLSAGSMFSGKITSDDFCFQTCLFNSDCRASDEKSFCHEGYCHGLFADDQIYILYQPLLPLCPLDAHIQRISC